MKKESEGSLETLALLSVTLKKKFLLDSSSSPGEFTQLLASSRINGIRNLPHLTLSLIDAIIQARLSTHVLENDATHCIGSICMEPVCNRDGWIVEERHREYMDVSIFHHAFRWKIAQSSLLTCIRHYYSILACICIMWAMCRPPIG